MKKTLFLLFIIIILIVVACSLPKLSLSPLDTSARNEYLLAAPAGSSATPTPFQPMPPTPMYQTGENSSVSNQDEISSEPTPIPTEASPWGNYAGPSVWPDIDVPEPVGLLPHPDGQVNIMLLGSDQRPNDGGFRTDTIQLLTVNPNEGTVKLTSLPRDLYVYIPGWTMQRINTAMAHGDFELLATTMEYNFGVRPDYYVLINFWTFRDVIDSLGGITIYSGADMCDQRDGYENYCVYQGATWMDGETALWYVRARHTSGDIDRGRRQQEVLQAIFDQLLSLNGLARAPELYQMYKDSVYTDLDFDILSSLLPIASHLAESQDLQRFTIGEAQVYDWTTAGGAMVLVPIRDQVLQVMNQVISEP